MEVKCGVVQKWQNGSGYNGKQGEHDVSVAVMVTVL